LYDLVLFWRLFGVFMSRRGQVGYLQGPNMKLHEHSFSEVTLFRTDIQMHGSKVRHDGDGIAFSNYEST